MREFTVPKFLQELHGSKINILQILLTYSSGITFLGIILLNPINEFNQLSLMRKIILSIIIIDISGGVIANLSKYTISHYNTTKLRIMFIMIHTLHPILLYYVFPNQLYLWLFTMFYTIITALIVNHYYYHENQREVAAFFIITGIFIILYLFHANQIINFLSIFFMLKIIFCFAVNH